MGFNSAFKGLIQFLGSSWEFNYSVSI